MLSHYTCPQGCNSTSKAPIEFLQTYSMIFFENYYKWLRVKKEFHLQWLSKRVYKYLVRGQNKSCFAFRHYKVWGKPDPTNPYICVCVCVISKSIYIYEALKKLWSNGRNLYSKHNWFQLFLINASPFGRVK